LLKVDLNLGDFTTPLSQAGRFGILAPPTRLKRSKPGRKMFPQPFLSSHNTDVGPVYYFGRIGIEEENVELKM
jgi:hypothetical protein